MDHTMTTDQLRILLTECAGPVDGLEWEDERLLDTQFEDLGYDSVAMFEVAGRIRRDHGVELADGEVSGVTTPRRLLARMADGARVGSPDAAAAS